MRLAALSALLLGAASSLPAWAGSSTHYSFSFGIPLGWPYYGAPAYYPAPYYYPPAAIIAPYPPVYVERDDVEREAPPATSTWYYYCAQSKAYYPYVRQCPGGWQRVPPRPAE
jgi:hypothetical protein